MKAVPLCVIAVMLLFAVDAQSMPQPNIARLEQLPRHDREPGKQNQFDAGLSYLSGTDVNLLIAVWGNPQARSELPNDGAMLTYSGSTRLNGVPPGCVMNIIAHKSVVVGFKFRGC